jgi:hypothetical protein
LKSQSIDKIKLKIEYQGLEDKVQELKHSDKEKSKEVQTENARPLGPN